MASEETTIMVRIKPAVNEDIKLFMKRNPTFETAGSVIEYAIRKIIRGSNK